MFKWHIVLIITHSLLFSSTVLSCNFISKIINKTPCKLTAYILLNISSTTHKENLYLTSFNDPSIKKLKITFIKKLPTRVAKDRMHYKYRGATTIGEITKSYGNGTICGKFEVPANTFIENGTLVYNTLRDQNNKTIAGPFSVIDDLLVISDDWRGLTTEQDPPFMCLLYPKRLTEQSEEDWDQPSKVSEPLH